MRSAIATRILSNTPLHILEYVRHTALATVNEFISAGKLNLDDKLRFWSLVKRRAAGEDVQCEIDNLLNKTI